ncbi:MAG: amidohydrolase [Planctomycetota bacterium]|nr:amidohydrolase [Planctomycetota bacterium]
MNTPSTELRNADWWTAVKASINVHEPSMIDFRRDLHAHPEPSGEEHRTTAQIADRIRAVGLAPRIMNDGCGIVVDLELDPAADSCVAIRSDLDCVAVDDAKNVPWRSTRPGCCHACGHDAHATMSLFTLLTLHEHLDSIRAMHPAANLRFIFQPAEETTKGAQRMIEQHALDGVDSIVALHVDPYLEAGHIGLRTGPLTANCLSFKITVTGQGGHSARPYQSLDPIPAATNIVSMMYQLCPRSMDSRYPLALTVTSIHAGQAFNAIPDSAEIWGTLRTSRDEDEQNVRARLHDVLRGIATTTGCTINIEFPYASPATNNDREVIERLWAAGEAALGKDRVTLVEMPSLGGEDFAYYQQVVPGAMVRLGTAFQDPNARVPLHAPDFDINESSLVAGVRFLCRAAIRSVVPER